MLWGGEGQREGGTAKASSRKEPAEISTCSSLEFPRKRGLGRLG